VLSFKRGRAYCEFDELSHDVLHNQIVKTTLARLVHYGGLDKDLRARLRCACDRMGDVSETPRLTEGTFRHVQLHRNNAFYRLLMDVCRLVVLQILPEESPGKFRFRDFLRDEKAMASLFQRFVRNFYAREQSKYRVTSVHMKWQATSGERESMELLPAMETDVSLTRPGEHLVIETKFYQDALRARYEKPRLHSGHLYQLFAYVRNLAMDADAPERVEGVLLYPAVESQLDLEYQMHGHRVRVVTINLDQDWREIRRELLALVERPPAPVAAA
jgi:5-methylcytosine-specific restriction enzyme subunit McrC